MEKFINSDFIVEQETIGYRAWATTQNEKAAGYIHQKYGVHASSVEIQKSRLSQWIKEAELAGMIVVKR
jgi:hypothetical protein